MFVYPIKGSKALLDEESKRAVHCYRQALELIAQESLHVSIMMYIGRLVLKNCFSMWMSMLNIGLINKG